MTWIFRIIGVVAYVNQRVSRYRGNGIPVNWLIMLLLGIFTALSITQVQEAFSNQGPVQEMTLAAIEQGSVLPDRNIRVTGHLYVNDTLVKTSGKNDQADEVWVPLVDDAKRVGLYVKVSDQFVVKNRSNAEITGMLRKIDHDLGSELRIKPRRVGDTMMGDRWMLVADEKPASPETALGVAVALLVPLVTIFVLTLLRNTVFVPGAEAVAPVSAHRAPPGEQSPLDLRGTGRFVLDTHKGYFIEVPCVLAELESGQKAILANVDASIRLMGQVTSQRVGTWAMVIRPGSMAKPKPGRIYSGLRARPALRIGYVDDLSGKRRRMIVSFADEGQRRRFEELLAAGPATPDMATVQ